MMTHAMCTAAMILASRPRSSTGSWWMDRLAELVAFSFIAVLLIALKLAIRLIRSVFGSKRKGEAVDGQPAPELSDRDTKPG